MTLRKLLGSKAFAWASLLVGILLIGGLTAIFISNTKSRSAVVPSDLIVPTQAVAALSTPSPKKIIPSIARPKRLKIPSLKIDAVIASVGLTPGGAMEVPKDIAETAWFSLGPRPGEIGSAVIAGHFGWRNNRPAVFNYLSKLRPGDKLDVVDENGAVTTFVVRELRSYAPNADASDVFVSNDGKSHLNLVTCEGVWNIAKQTYPSRFIVFTDKLVE
ncbi:MAG: class F sortase [Patescibacteria group bacterium]